MAREVNLKVNGEDVSEQLEENTLLVDLLRETLRQAACCCLLSTRSVLIDRRPTPAGAAHTGVPY